MRKNAFELDANPFRYDSSDEEEPKVEEIPKEVEPSNTASQTVRSGKLWTEPFFFQGDDYRLQGIHFLNTLNIILN